MNARFKVWEQEGFMFSRKSSYVISYLQVIEVLTWVLNEKSEKVLILSGSLKKRKFYPWNNPSDFARGSAESIRDSSGHAKPNRAHFLRTLSLSGPFERFLHAFHLYLIRLTQCIFSSFKHSIALVYLF